MPKANKMICPDCGVEMNHHADKVDYTATIFEPDAVDPDFGGVLKEAHTCPKCGKTDTRKVE
jgi:ribosomal protein S27AE